MANEEETYEALSSTLMCLKSISQLIHDFHAQSSPPSSKLLSPSSSTTTTTTTPSPVVPSFVEDGGGAAAELQRALYGALKTTKRLIDEHLLNVETSLLSYDAETLVPLDELLLAGLPAEVIRTFRGKYLLPLSLQGRKETFDPAMKEKIRASVDSSLPVLREENSALDAQIRAALRIPCGHTAFSWLGDEPHGERATPSGHTKYSFPPSDPGDDDANGGRLLLSLRAIVEDVRAFERTKTFHRFLLNGIVAQKRQQTDYSKDNFSYGTTPYQSYLRLSENSDFKAAVNASKCAGSSPVGKKKQLFYIALG